MSSAAKALTQSLGANRPIKYFKVGEYDFSYQVNNNVVIVTNETIGEVQTCHFFGDECLGELARDVATDMYHEFKEFLRIYK